jgi:allantoin racemase
VRILVINANTSQEVTGRVESEARHVASPETEIVAVSADFGPGIIRTRADNTIAAHAVLTAYAHHGTNCDAVVLAVSTDTGLSALREISSVPVVGMTEAALFVACMQGGRFGLIVFDVRAQQVFHEVVASHGQLSRLGAIHPIAMTLEEFRKPDRVKTEVAAGVEKLVREHAVDSVIVTGATTAGIARSLQGTTQVALIDGIASGVALAESLARLKLPRPTAGSFVKEASFALRNVDTRLSDFLGGSQI